MKRPTRDEVRVFDTAADFRRWLEEHHAVGRELFVGYYRKGAGKTAMTYAEAVEEALNFGWIDGITYRIDDELTASRFTPRRKGSSWSAVNIARAGELIAAGRMAAPGLRAFEERDRTKDAVHSYERTPQELPAEWLRQIQAQPAAWAYWQSETPSYRRTVTHWVMSAKRPETRARRLAALVIDSAAGRRIRPMLVGREQKAVSW